MIRNIFMYGPGFGHNSQLWLDFFQTNSIEYKCYFYCKKLSFDKKKYSNIVFINNESIIKYIRFLFFKKYDIYYLHSSLNSPFIAIILTSVVRARVRIINIWGHLNANSIFKFKLIRILFKCFDFIRFNWYGTLEKYAKVFPEIKKKSLVKPWGISSEWFLSLPGPKLDFTKSFLQSLPRDGYLFFWPRSLYPNHRYDLMVLALAKIKNEGFKDFEKIKIYIWHGNIVDKQYVNKISKMIEKDGLTNTIFFVKHPFLSISDYINIVNRMDVMVSLLDHDQLGEAVIQGLYLKKHLLISDIVDYRFLNSKFDFSVDLIPNEIEEISLKIKNICLHLINKNDTNVFEKRKKIIERNHCFVNNAISFFNFIEGELS